ncbi:hypothetical protein PanWU01x14_231130, partial [Parasponia andersonii]
YWPHGSGYAQNFQTSQASSNQEGLLVPNTIASIGHRVQVTPKIFRLRKLLVIRDAADILT